MIDKQFLWYRESEANPERHTYNILIVNVTREIEIIMQRLRMQLKPVIDERRIACGMIRNSAGLHYELWELVSPVLEPDFSKIYQGKVKGEDRRLKPRQDPNDWNDLINKVSSGKL